MIKLYRTVTSLMGEKYGQMIQTIQSKMGEMKIPPYLHPQPKHTFSIHQLIIMLVLMQYEAKTSGRLSSFCRCPLRSEYR